MSTFNHEVNCRQCNDLTDHGPFCSDTCEDMWYDRVAPRDSQMDESEPNESMDGDHASGLASAGWGTDEDYGYYGEAEDY